MLTLSVRIKFTRRRKIAHARIWHLSSWYHKNTCFRFIYFLGALFCVIACLHYLMSMLVLFLWSSVVPCSKCNLRHRLWFWKISSPTLDLIKIFICSSLTCRVCHTQSEIAGQMAKPARQTQLPLRRGPDVSESNLHRWENRYLMEGKMIGQRLRMHRPIWGNRFALQVSQSHPVETLLAYISLQSVWFWVARHRAPWDCANTVSLGLQCNFTITHRPIYVKIPVVNRRIHIISTKIYPQAHRNGSGQL